MEKNIYQKLLEFKAQNVTLVRDTKWFNYKYATLEQIQDKVEPILQELKLLLHSYTKDNVVYTRIIDTDNPQDYIESGVEIGKITTTKKLKDDGVEVQEQDPQAIGSIITYYRRYNIVQLLDLQTEDDDASWASSRAKAKTHEQTEDTPSGWTKPKTITSTNEYCPECWEHCETKKWLTKDGRPYELGECKNCNVKFFVNRKDLSDQPF